MDGAVSRPGVMTLRVSRDGGRTWGERKRVVMDPGEGADPLSRPLAFPPCECARCDGRGAVPDDHVAPARAALTRTGYCGHCGCVVPDAMVVALIERGSGPPASVLACVTHARELLAYAPQFVHGWLAADLEQVTAGLEDGST